MRSTRVLVVDDEPAIRALVAKIVERQGFPVEIARDGAEAITLLDADDYGVIVLDLMMPNVDGYGLIEYLKQRGGQHPAVIVISAGDSASLRRLDGSMVHSIVRKPFDIDVLGDLIAAAARTMEEAQPVHDSTILRFRKNDSVC
jgi:DNA-binding response OmpR family regulator